MNNSHNRQYWDFFKGTFLDNSLILQYTYGALMRCIHVLLWMLEISPNTMGSRDVWPCVELWLVEEILYKPFSCIVTEVI